MKELGSTQIGTIAGARPVPRSTSRTLDKYSFPLALTCAVSIGFVLRIFFLSRSDFPLNDGGLFYQMVLDLQRYSFVLPAFTSYNGADLPFGYPPLALYVAGLVQAITNMGLPDVFRFLPLACNIATIFVLGVLARNMFGSRPAAVWTVFTFALLPRSYEWMIMGGGLTRSLGFLFALLTLNQVYLLFTRQESKYLPWAALFAGLTLTSHLEMAWFTAYSILLLAVFYVRSWRMARGTMLIGLGAVLFSSPWWGAVIWYHGLGPFLASGSSHGSVELGIFQLIRLNPFQQVAALVAVLGIAYCLANRQLFLPIWLGSMFLLDSRSAATTATVALALLAGLGIVKILVPLLADSSNGEDQPSWFSRLGSEAGFAQNPVYFKLGLLAAVLAAWQIYATMTSGQPALLNSLSRDDRAAMSWVAGNTPMESKFLVITGEAWAQDEWSEWFPVLACRTSVATVQGYEWKKDFDLREKYYDQIQVSIYRDSEYLNAWSRNSRNSFTHVYVVKKPYTAGLINSIQHDSDYLQLYDGPKAAIFRHIDVKIGGQTADVAEQPDLVALHGTAWEAK